MARAGTAGGRCRTKPAVHSHATANSEGGARGAEGHRQLWSARACPTTTTTTGRPRSRRGTRSVEREAGCVIDAWLPRGRRAHQDVAHRADLGRRRSVLTVRQARRARFDGQSGARAPQASEDRSVGSFYVNVTLLGRDLDAVRPVAPRPAFAFTEGDSVVLFTEEDDEGDPKSGEGLSAALGCIAFSAGVHDDDIFFFEVHDRGRSVLHGAVPDPMEFFGIDAEMVADFDRSVVDEVGGTLPGGTPDANALVEAIGRGEPSAVRAALEGEYVLATERHQAMVEALGLPAGAVGWGYRYLARDSSGYSGPRLSRLGGDPGARQRVEEVPPCVVSASDVGRV